MKTRVLAALLTLCAGQLLVTGVWLGLDEGVQYTDAAYHFSQVAELVDAAESGAEGLRERAAVDERQRYGGLFYAVAALLASVAGLHPARVILACAAVLIPLLTFGAYVLGWEFARPDRREATGLLAAAGIGLLPGIFNYTRVFVLDLALTAAVLWCVVAILAALRARREGRDPRPALAGVWLGFIAASSIKLNAVAFLLGPLWILARPTLIARLKAASVRFFVDVGIALVATLCACFWLLFGPRGPAIRRTLVEATWPGAALQYARRGALGEYPGHYLAHLRDASWDVAHTTLMSTLGAAACVLGLAAFLWFFGRRYGCEDPDGRVQRDLAFWWFTPPAVMVVGLLRGLYDERYILPLLPLVAVLIAVSAMDLPNRFRRPGVAAALVGAALQFTLVSFPILPTARPFGCVTLPGWAPESRSGPAVWVCGLYPEYRFLERRTFPQRPDGLVASLEARLQPVRKQLGRPLTAVFLDDLNETFYRLYQRDLFGNGLLAHDSALLVHQCWDDRWMTAVFETPKQVERIIAAADVVFMRYGTPDQGADRAVRGRRCSVFWRQSENFTLGGSDDLPDGTEVRFYVRTDEVDFLD